MDNNNNLFGENGTSAGDNQTPPVQPSGDAPVYGTLPEDNVPPSGTEQPVYGTGQAYGQQTVPQGGNSHQTYGGGQQGYGQPQQYPYDANNTASYGNQQSQNTYGSQQTQGTYGSQGNGQNYNANNYNNQNYIPPNSYQNTYSQYGQNYNNSNYTQNDLNKMPLSTGEWVLTLMVTIIPCVNIVMLFIWAFGNGNEARRNFSRAQLIMSLIGIVLSVLFVVVMVLSFGSMSYFFDELIRDINGYY